MTTSNVTMMATISASRCMPPRFTRQTPSLASSHKLGACCFHRAQKPTWRLTSRVSARRVSRWPQLQAALSLLCSSPSSAAYAAACAAAACASCRARRTASSGTATSRTKFLSCPVRQSLHSLRHRHRQRRIPKRKGLKIESTEAHWCGASDEKISLAPESIAREAVGGRCQKKAPKATMAGPPGSWHQVLERNPSGMYRCTVSFAKPANVATSHAVL
mmetsp:Transcript_2674/g.5673  ORF Transcript_2674/g.5673 Transcript_2674/m.5673 type:complete len:218 (+) Transcript_2674:412-1065(+)